MFAIQGVYDAGVVKIDEPVPVNTKYDVVVTFLKPVELTEKDADREVKMAALHRITGILSDSSVTLENARAERLSRQ